MRNYLFREKSFIFPALFPAKLQMFFFRLPIVTALYTIVYNGKIMLFFCHQACPIERNLIFLFRLVDFVLKDPREKDDDKQEETLPHRIE